MDALEHAIRMVMAHKMIERAEAERHIRELHAHCLAKVSAACPWMPSWAGRKPFEGDPQEEEALCSKK